MPPNKPSSNGNEYDNGATEINVSQAFGIRKAKGARNLLDPKKAKSIAMAEWENIDSDETKYKRMFSRSEVPPKHEVYSNTKKKEISWADSMMNSRKYFKNGHPDRHSDEDVDKSLVRTENEKQEDEIRQITQTSVVYFSKSNSYDGRVVMASRRDEEAKEKAKEKKLKCKKHRPKEDDYERKECLDAALAAAAVRAVVEVSPQLSQQGLPRAYRVKTSHSHSHSFLVEPVWNEGMQSSESVEPSMTERPQTAPEETKMVVPKECPHGNRRCHHRTPLSVRTRSHSPPSEPLSSSMSWNTSASHTANSGPFTSDVTTAIFAAPTATNAVPAAPALTDTTPTTTTKPSSTTTKASATTTKVSTTTTKVSATTTKTSATTNATNALALAQSKAHPTRTITLPEEAIPPCNVSVNIQLVASTSNVSARAVLTDRAGSMIEVPASVRWEAQNKAKGYSVLDTMNVAKSLEHALAKAVMENTKSITSAISISNNSEKGTTTTSSLENAARIALIEKSTCTTTEELSSEGMSEKETRVTTFVQERMLKNCSDRPACATVSPIPEEEFTSSSIEIPQNIISATGFEKGSLVSSVESVNPPNIPQKVSVSSTGPYSSTDTNLGSKDKLESCVSKSRSSLDNPRKTGLKFEQQESKTQTPPHITQRLEIQDSSATEDTNKRTTQKNEPAPKFLPKDMDFQSTGTLSSQEYLGKMRMDGWPQGRLENAWVNEVTRMVSEELKARAVRRLRAEDRPAGLRRAAMEERMPKDPMEQLVALQVRKVLGEMDKRGKRIPQDIVSEERTSSELLDERAGMEADTSALETDTVVEHTEIEHEESDRQQRLEVRMMMTEENSSRSTNNHSKTTVRQSHHNEKDVGGSLKQRSSSRSRERRKSREKKQRKKVVVPEPEREIENTNFDLGWNPVPAQWNAQQIPEDIMRAPGEIDQLNVGWADENNQYSMEEGHTAEELQFISDVDMSEVTTADEQDMMMNSMNAGKNIGTRINRAQSSEASEAPSYGSYAYSMRTEASIESTEHGREFFPVPHSSIHSGPKSTTGSTGSRHEKKMDQSQVPNQYRTQSQQFSQKQNPVNTASGTPFQGHFPAAAQNPTSWPLAMTPFGPYGPFPQQMPWYPPQMNPFVPGPVPYPGMLPYRLMVPYRPMPERNTGSTANNYLPKNQTDLTGSNIAPPDNGNIGLGGCIPLNYAMTTNMRKQLVPVDDNNIQTARENIENMGQQYATVQQAKVIPSSGLHTLYSKSDELDTAEMSKTTEEIGKPVFTPGVMTSGFFAALVQHIIERLDQSSDHPSFYIEPHGTSNPSGETLSRQAHPCDSTISTTSYTTQEETTNGPGVSEIEVKEKAVSDLESSLVALLRKCSHALGQQAEQLAGALQEQQLQAMDPGIDLEFDTSSEATCRSLQRVERQQRVRSPVRTLSPQRPRMRPSEDPLELLRQMRIRQQERELARARLPGQKMPFRRSKIVASCAKKEK